MGNAENVGVGRHCSARRTRAQARKKKQAAPPARCACFRRLSRIYFSGASTSCGSLPASGALTAGLAEPALLVRGWRR